MAKAVRDLHSHGIGHRQVSCSNFLVVHKLLYDALSIDHDDLIKLTNTNFLAKQRAQGETALELRIVLIGAQDARLLDEKQPFWQSKEQDTDANLPDKFVLPSHWFGFLDGEAFFYPGLEVKLGKSGVTDFLQ